MGYGGGNINLVSEYLRRMAPAQSHEGRREFFQAAEFLHGINIDEGGPVAVSVPVWRRGRLLGRVEFLVTYYAGNEVDAHPFVGQNLFRPEGRTEAEADVDLAAGEGT